MRKYELMEIIEVNGGFESFVADYFECMVGEIECNEDLRQIVRDWDDYYAGNTNLVYTWRCIELFKNHFEEILEICEDYKIECCGTVSHDIEEMVHLAFDYKINQFMRDIEYFIEYEMEDEDEDEE